MSDVKFAGNCESCGYPQLKKFVVKYRTEEWQLLGHKCEYIPAHILLLLDLAKAKRVAKNYIKKYRTNSDDKIIFASQGKVEDSLMSDILSLIGEDDDVSKWWNSGFPHNVSYDVYHSTSHYQLIHYARNLIKELL